MTRIGFQHMSRFHTWFRHFCLLSALAAMTLSAGCSTDEYVSSRSPRESTREYRPPSLPRIEDKRSTVPRKNVVVGVLVPLSGPYGQLGSALLEAAQLALFDMGARNITLVPRDTAGTPEGAAAAAALALKEDAAVLLGPVFAANIRAVTPIAHKEKVPVIGFSTDRAVAGDGIYILGFTPEAQIERIVTYAAARGLKKFAALIPDSAYGERVAAAFVQTVESQAIDGRETELVAIERYAEDTEGLAAPVKRLARYDTRRQALLDEREALAAFGEEDDMALELLALIENTETLGDLDYEAVLIPAGGAMLRSLAPLLPYYEIDPALIRFLGTGLWDDPELRREPALLGAWFAGPAPDAARIFAGHFQKVYGRVPPRLASLAYDAVALTVNQIHRAPRAPFSKSALTSGKGFVGIDGLFRLDESGAAERALAIIEITQSGLTPIQPPPKRFDPVDSRRSREDREATRR